MPHPCFRYTNFPCITKFTQNSSTSTAILASATGQPRRMVSRCISSRFSPSTTAASAAYFRELGLMTPALEAAGTKLAESGKTPLFFSLAGRPLGIAAVADEVKEDSAAAVAELKAMGIRVLLLTGDNRRSAGAIAERIGVEGVISKGM